MRFTLPAILALLAVAQTVTAECCYYGSIGACRRALEVPALRLRASELTSREVCCCAAENSDACETHCVSVMAESYANILLTGRGHIGLNHSRKSLQRGRPGPHVCKCLRKG